MSHKKFVRSEELLHHDRLLRQHVAVVALAVRRRSTHPLAELMCLRAGGGVVRIHSRSCGVCNHIVAYQVGCTSTAGGRRLVVHLFPPKNHFSHRQM